MIADVQEVDHLFFYAGAQIDQHETVEIARRHKGFLDPAALGRSHTVEEGVDRPTADHVATDFRGPSDDVLKAGAAKKEIVDVALRRHSDLNVDVRKPEIAIEQQDALLLFGQGMS
jgi:hypothetical protein